MQSLILDYNGKPYPLSAQHIRDVVNHVAGVSTMSPRYRLLDTTLTPVPTGETASLVGDSADLTAWVQSCRVMQDTSRGTQRTADFVIKETAGLRFDPLHHLIQVFVDYWDTNGNLQFEVPVGIFAFILPDRDLADAGNIWRIAGADLTTNVAQLGFLNSYTIAKGTNYVTAITTMLQMSYLPLSQGGSGATPAGLDDAGPNIPASRIKIDATTKVTPQTITFTRKENKLVAINSLLDAITYRNLWVDEVGNFRSSPRPDFSAGPPPFGWTYNTDASSIIQSPVTWRPTNQADLANIVAVYCEHNGAVPFSSIKYNSRNTSSTLCLTRMGRAIMKVIEDSTIPDQAGADLRAYVELQYAALLAEQVSFNTVLNPFHQAYDQLSITITDSAGQTVLGSDYGFEETGWTMDMNSRLMTHTVGRRLVI